MTLVRHDCVRTRYQNPFSTIALTRPPISSHLSKPLVEPTTAWTTRLWAEGRMWVDGRIAGPTLPSICSHGPLGCESIRSGFHLLSIASGTSSCGLVQNDLPSRRQNMEGCVVVGTSRRSEVLGANSLRLQNAVCQANPYTLASDSDS